MYKKKKVFPTGTFISTPKRVLAITQLCIAFSLILWYGFQPFMGEYFTLRSKMLVYEYLMGNSEFRPFEPSHQNLLKRHKERFKELTLEDQRIIIQDYQFLQNRASRSTWTKIQDGLIYLLLGIPPFEMAWLVFSVIIAILILLKVEGANQAAWLLPLIALAYGIDNRLNGQINNSSPDAVLFPSEKTIIQEYLQEPLGLSWMEQKKQLQKGWENYLILNWLPKNNQIDLLERQEQLEQAEFYFTLARLQLLHPSLQKSETLSFNQKLNYLILFIYFAWNLFFALGINQSKKNDPIKTSLSLAPI